MRRVWRPLAIGLLLAAPLSAAAHVPPETSAELRLREGTVELSLSVSALHLLERSGGDGSGSGAEAAATQIARALGEVRAIALRCGGQVVPLEVAGRLDGDALVAASLGTDRRLALLLRGDRPAADALRAGCELTLPPSFGPYYASMSEPVTGFASGGGSLSLSRAPETAAAAPQQIEQTTKPAWTGQAVLVVVAAAAAGVGYGIGRRGR